MSTSSMPDARQLQRPPAAGAHGRHLGERVAVGHVDVLVAVDPGVREHPAIRGDAERRGATARTHHDRRGHVDVVVRVHHLGVGPADHPVGRGDRGDLVGGERGARPGVIVGRRHRAEPRPQRGDVAAVRRWIAPGGGADGRLEHRIHLHGQQDAAGGLGRMGRRQLVTEHDRRRTVAGAGVPVEARPLPLGAGAGAPRLTAHDDGEVEAGGDVEGGAVDDRLGHVATGVRDGVLRRPWCRGGRRAAPPGRRSATTTS